VTHMWMSNPLEILVVPNGPWRCFLPVCALLLASAMFALGQRYVEISAEIETVTFGPDETNYATGGARRTVSFVCTVGTNEWRIDNDFPENGEEKYLFDGTNLYTSLRTTKPAAQAYGGGGGGARSRLLAAPFEVSRTNVSITIVPATSGFVIGFPGLNIPWLVFCSGSYLRHAERRVPAPVSGGPDAYGYSDSTETFGDELGLPRRIDLHTSGESFERFWRETLPTNSWNGRVLNSGLADGLLKFHYAVSESTNVMGWHIPIAFSFFQNEQDDRGGWVRRYGGNGRVLSISASARPRSIFTPELGQTIVDHRFRDAMRGVQAITYRSTNDHAAATDDAALQARFAAEVERAARSKRASGLKERVFPAPYFFLATVVLAAIMLCFSRHNNPR
jgi:hypothetical protein